MKKSLSGSCAVAYAALVVSCVPPPVVHPTQEERDASFNAEMDRAGVRMEAEVRAKEQADAADQARYERERVQRDAAQAAEQIRDAQLERDRYAQQQALLLKNQTARAEEERAERAKNAPRDHWLETHCKLETPETIYVMHCDPVCWREAIYPPAEYKCSGKPPEAGWIAAANASVSGVNPNRQARAVQGYVGGTARFRAGR